MDDIPKSVKYAATGAAAALVLAMFTPAAVLLGLEAAVVAGVYIYRKKQAAKEDIIDVTPAQGGEEK